MAFHIVLISIQVPQGAEKSLFERGIFFVFSPVQRLASGSVRAIGSAWRNYFDLRRVRRENEKLKREAFFLRQDIRFLEDRLRFSRSEADLRALLTEFRGTIVPARVIGIDSANPHQSIVIDKGSLDGVRKDMAVCDMTGALLGRTLGSVSLKEAVVQLITDKDSSVSVRSEETQLTGAISGTSRDSCELRYILASAAGVREGLELRTTGFDRIYPAGLRVGVIESVGRDAASPIFLKIVIRPYFGFDTVDAVAVLTVGPGGGR
jgi:rod shape-determining protein MreC